MAQPVIELQPSRLKLIALSLFTLVLGAMFIGQILDPGHVHTGKGSWRNSLDPALHFLIEVVFALTFIATTLLSVFYLFQRYALRLSPEGAEVGTLFGRRFFTWDRITGIFSASYVFLQTPDEKRPGKTQAILIPTHIIKGGRKKVLRAFAVYKPGLLPDVAPLEV